MLYNCFIFTYTYISNIKNSSIDFVKELTIKIFLKRFKTLCRLILHLDKVSDWTFFYNFQNKETDKSGIDGEYFTTKKIIDIRKKVLHDNNETRN